MKSPEISIVTAITEQGGMADDGNGRAAWYMPDDLLRFRAITMGHPVVIAEPTFRTVLNALGMPLSGRTNIIVDPTEPIPSDCIAVPDIVTGLAHARHLDTDEIFVMGNQSFYEAAWPHVTKLYLTIVLGDFATNETFPDYTDFQQLSSQPGSSGGFIYDFRIFSRPI